MHGPRFAEALSRFHSSKAALFWYIERMKFTTFVPSGSNSPSYGFLSEKSGIVDLASAFGALQKERGTTSATAIPTTLLALIENYDTFAADVQALAKRAREGNLPAGTTTHAEGSVKLLSPIPRPPSMRDGYAFRQHVLTARRNRGLEMIPEFDEFPVFYFTNHGAVTGPGDVQVREAHTERLDFELEAAIVVGKKARDLTPKQADDVIFGLTIMNDWSARALQMKEMTLSLGPAKGKDFATSLGPYLVTLDELEGCITKSDRGMAFDLGMKATVNGKQLSTGNVKDMNWTFSEILARASYGVDLYPGDVLGSGTCGTGCLLELNGSKITDNLWLKPGDEVVLEIDRLGKLENRIVLTK